MSNGVKRTRRGRIEARLTGGKEDANFKYKKKKKEKKKKKLGGAPL